MTASFGMSERNRTEIAKKEKFLVVLISLTDLHML